MPGLAEARKRRFCRSRQAKRRDAGFGKMRIPARRPRDGRALYPPLTGAIIGLIRL
jgi:hypothetical protein